MTDWLEALRDRGGPLVEAAQGFVVEHLGREPHRAPRGRDALAELADAIDRWCDQADPGDAADRELVESAGAFLGLLLIDHLGGEHAERDGRHRVRLGLRGFFDPFATLEEVLDADDPRAELAACVRVAEAEARGEGRISRVVRALERALERERPAMQVAEHFERYVRLAPDVELDLDRVVEATTDQGDEAVEQAVAKLLAMLPGGDGPEGVAWDEARERLVPRLMSARFLEELREAHPDRGDLWAEPLGHGVRVGLLLDHDDRARYVRRDEVDRWGRQTHEPLAVAVQNLAARSDRARFGRIDTPQGPLVVARSGDGLDAARLLLPTLHDVLEPELGSPFLVAVPHRDTLLAAPSGPPALVHALCERASDEAARAPHRIGEGLFEVAPAGIAARRRS